MTDPNWLYSTIAQSSAAIVAIIGGFITHSVLTLAAEKRSLAHQRTDKETRLGALKVEEGRLSNIYETMKVDKFFSAIAEELKEVEELPTLEALMQRYPGWNLDHKILQREYENLSKRRLEARQFIKRHSDKIDPEKSVLFDEWVKENKLDISYYDYELLEEEYYRFRAREEEILEEEKRKAISPQLRGMFEIKMPIMPISPQLTQYELYQRQKEDRRLEDVESRLSSLRHEIFLLESEVANLDTRLRTFSYPPNLGWGAAALGFLSVFGILLPVIILASEAFYTWAKSLITVTFWLGIIVVFAYIVFQIGDLRRK